MKIRSNRKEKPSLGITSHLEGLASSSEVLNTQEIWRLHKNASTRNTYMTLQRTDKNENARPGEIRGLQQTLPAWQSADNSDHRSSFPFGQDLYQYQYSNTHRKEQTQTLFYTVLLFVPQGSKTKGRAVYGCMYGIERIQLQVKSILRNLFRCWRQRGSALLLSNAFKFFL